LDEAQGLGAITNVASRVCGQAGDRSVRKHMD